METNYSNISIDWAAIRDGIDLETVIRDHGGVVKNRKFLCPAHNDTNPSAELLKKKNNQRWLCRSCGEGGSCVDYVMFSMGYAKNEAAIYLGQNYGVGLSEETEQKPALARMLSKEILKELGLKQNPFFAARDHVSIPPEQMGTEWDLSSIPEYGYEKDLGALKLDEEEAKFLLRGKCMEYLTTHKNDSTQRRTIERLYKEITKNKKTEKRVFWIK